MAIHQGACQAGCPILECGGMSGQTRVNKKANAVTGGGRLPASKIGVDGKFARGDLHSGVDSESGSGTSIFDPVLCELIYRWFCPPNGLVLDPFAGGSVRGIVASKLGRDYVGIDLRPEQVDANRAQADRICDDHKPRWIVGDSRDIATLALDEYDLIFSCPPYFDLEVYSEDQRDLSTMEWEPFLEQYRWIIAQSCAMLRSGRFACFVVGDMRDERGFYRNFPAETIAAFQAAGMTLYNEAILVTAVGSLPIRIGKQFGSYRKLGKTHQNVLVFWRGDPKSISDILGETEFGELPMPDPDPDNLLKPKLLNS